MSGIVAFVQAAEHMSFVAAGRALGISASAIGKNIAKLEESVGTRLFHRTTRRISLTEEGAAFYERCRRILDDLRDAEAMVSDATRAPRGRLRVSVPTIGYRFLVAVLPEFRRRYPEIELDIDFNDRLIDLVENGLDVVIRSGALNDSSLMSRRLGPFRFVLCASPAYLKRCGIPQCPRELEDHDCLRFRFPTSGKLQTWHLADADGIDPFRRPSPLTCNNMEALRGAAIAGLGIAYMPEFWRGMRWPIVAYAQSSTIIAPILATSAFFGRPIASCFLGFGSSSTIWLKRFSARSKDKQTFAVRVPTAPIPSAAPSAT